MFHANEERRTNHRSSKCKKNHNIWVMDANHNYMTWFQKAQDDICLAICKITGMSRDDLETLRIPYAAFIHSDQAELYWNIFKRCAEEVSVHPNYTFGKLYNKRPQNLQITQDTSITLDRPDITIISKTEFKHPIFILEVISSPNLVEELIKLIRYLLIVHEMYELSEVYGALGDAQRIRFVKLNCSDPTNKQVSVTEFQNFVFWTDWTERERPQTEAQVRARDQTRKIFSLIDYFVNSTLPENLDPN